MRVVVDKRTEFMGIILMLSKYNKVYEHQKNLEANKSYIEKIYEWFGEYKNDELISLTNQVIDKYTHFSYSNPFDLMLRFFDEDFNLINRIEQIEYSDILEDDLCKQFLNEISKFYSKTRFEEFYRMQEKFYSQCISFQNKYLEDKSLEEYYLNYYGVNKLQNVECILVLADSCVGGHGLEIDGVLKPTLSVQFNNNEQYPCPISLLFHEMSHPIINPLTDKYLNSDKLKDISLPSYSGQKSIINEYIIRSSEIILLENFNNYEAVSRRILLEKNRGFNKIEDVVKLLKIYLNNRDKYITIQDYYPILLEEIIKILN